MTLTAVNTESQRLQHPTQPEIFLSSARSLLDIPFVHYQLSTQQYWSLGIPLETITTAINNSFSFGIYDSSVFTNPSDSRPRQIGFARWVTDYTCFGCLSDVFIIPEYRRRGLGAWVVQEAVKMREVAMCRRLMLVTRDPGFYEKLKGEKWVRSPVAEELTGITTMEIRRDNKVLYGISN